MVMDCLEDGGRLKDRFNKFVSKLLKSFWCWGGRWGEQIEGKSSKFGLIITYNSLISKTTIPRRANTAPSTDLESTVKSEQRGDNANRTVKV